MNIVSFGGGTNSADVLDDLWKQEITIGLSSAGYTGAEHPHTYPFIGIINHWLAERGMPQMTVV